MADAAMDMLATDLEKIAAREWLRAEGLPEDILVRDFALHCLRDEGIVEADHRLAETILWNCTGFPSFWHIPGHGTHPIECCSTQLRGWARVAIRSKEAASRLMNDPTWSFEQALAMLDEQDTDARARLLEDED